MDNLTNLVISFDMAWQCGDHTFELSGIPHSASHLFARWLDGNIILSELVAAVGSIPGPVMTLLQQAQQVCGGMS